MYISMAQCKTAVTPLLMHCSYYTLALSHRYASLSLDELKPGDVVMNPTLWIPAERGLSEYHPPFINMRRCHQWWQAWTLHQNCFVLSFWGNFRKWDRFSHFYWCQTVFSVPECIKVEWTVWCLLLGEICYMQSFFNFLRVISLVLGWS